MGRGSVFAGHASIEEIEKLSYENKHIADDVVFEFIGTIGGKCADDGGDAAEEVGQCEGVSVPDVWNDLAVERKESKNGDGQRHAIDEHVVDEHEIAELQRFNLVQGDQ